MDGSEWDRRDRKPTRQEHWFDRWEPMKAACDAQGPDWQSDGKHFEKARRIVARKLKWKVEWVMDWEVLSYLRLDRPAWAEREGLRIPHDPR